MIDVWVIVVILLAQAAFAVALVVVAMLVRRMACRRFDGIDKRIEQIERRGSP